MRTNNMSSFKRKSKNCPYKASWPEAIINPHWLELPCLELISMVPKVFEPLKFDCIKKLIQSILWIIHAEKYFVGSVYIEDLTRVVISYHVCKILFIIWSFKIGFYCLQNEYYFNMKTYCWHGRCQWRYVFAPKCYYTCSHTIFMTRRYPLNKLNSNMTLTFFPLSL